MIDTLRAHQAQSERSAVLEDLRLSDRSYAVLTLHRPASVDNPEVLKSLLDAVAAIGRELPVIFPVHPRTRQILHQLLPPEAVERPSSLRLTEPLGYLDFLKLMAHARLVLTDSGGVQEETTVLGVPCLTLRTSTERPATILEGTNTLVGLDPKRIVTETRRVLGKPWPQARIPELWDGRAASRIVEILAC